MSTEVELELPKLEVVGKAIARIDANEKVRGAALFAFDMNFKNMLYGKLKRSQIPHGKILRIDVSKARAYPGVRGVLTGYDVPNALHGSPLRDTPTLARDRVRFQGEPVAAVAADSLEIAEEAVELIDIKYEELLAVTDAEVSLSKDPPVIIHPDLPIYQSSAVFGARLQPDHPNVCNYHRGW